MDVGPSSTTSTFHTNQGMPIRCEELERVSRFAGFSVQRVVAKLAEIPPASSFEQMAGHDDHTFWFTNEFHGAYITEGEHCLKETFKELKAFSPVSQRRISIVTGESGLLSCIPELAELSNLIIIADQDPILLFFLYSLFEKLRGTEAFGETEYEDLIKQAYSAVKEKMKNLLRTERNVVKFAMSYKAAFEGWHCFSSKERFEQTKEALAKVHINPLCVNYHDPISMEKLAGIISDEELSIAFFNVSNVLEYYRQFFSWKRFPCPVKGIDSTQHMKKLPLSENTLCAYSTLIYSDKKSAMTCRGNVFFDKAYELQKLNSYYQFSGKTLGEEYKDKDLIVGVCIKLAKMDPESRYGVRALFELRNLLAHSSEEALAELANNYWKIERALDTNKGYKTTFDQHLHQKHTFHAILQLACGEVHQTLNRYVPPQLRKARDKGHQEMHSADP